MRYRLCVLGVTFIMVCLVSGSWSASGVSFAVPERLNAGADGLAIFAWLCALYAIIILLRLYFLAIDQAFIQGTPGVAIRKYFETRSFLSGNYRALSADCISSAVSCRLAWSVANGLAALMGVKQNFIVLLLRQLKLSCEASYLRLDSE